MKNKIAIVLDRSGSMGPIQQEVIRTFNQQVQEICDQAKKTGQDTTVTYVSFANNPRLHYLNASVNTLKCMEKKDFFPNGSTALFDAVLMTVDHLQKLPDAQDEQTSFLVLVLTDGEDNNSAAQAKERLQTEMLRLQKTDRWSFAFLVPPGQTKWFNTNFQIPLDNIREWENTRAGTQAAGAANAQGIGNYFTARSQGKTSVEKFYVQTNLAALTVDQVKKLDDISDRFKEYEVHKEMPIKEFVEEKTRKPYVIGASYYLLMKKETIQATKQVLIREKGKKAIWGGTQARQLIGLPDGASAKVTPGNHANFDIYIKSTSVNRKVVRGTKILVDVTQTKDNTPTWDHTAVTVTQ